MRHLALIVPGFIRIGGAERQLIQMAHEMRRRGWRVSVVALSGPGGDEGARLVESGVAFLSLGMRKGLADPRGWWRFHRWLRRERPDVVHTHLPHATWLARWSRLGAPVRVLVDTLHTTATGGLGRRLGYQWSTWLPDRVTAVSDAVGEAYLRAGMVMPEKLAVLPNGVDAAYWRPDAKARDAVRADAGLDDAFLWVAAGRLDPVKDYPTLLRAMAALPEPARLVIAGHGPDAAELHRLAAELGLERRVRFLSFEADVRRWMRAADGFVLTSRWEGLPMALLEAAACGVPIVATDVPGTREAVIDGETGRLTSAGDVPALREAMAGMMLLGPAERQAMGERARRMVLEKFSLEQVLQRWEDLYESLLAKNSMPRRWGRRA